MKKKILTILPLCIVVAAIAWSVVAVVKYNNTNSVQTIEGKTTKLVNVGENDRLIIYYDETNGKLIYRSKPSGHLVIVDAE